MKPKSYIHALLLMVLFLVACERVSPANTTPASTPSAIPEKGTASVTGRIVSTKTGVPLADTIVRLADVVRQGDKGAYVLDVAFNPGAQTNADGYFIFENLPPKEYVIVVGDVYDVYKVIAENDGSPKIWKVDADQVLEVGELKVDLEK